MIKRHIPTFEQFVFENDANGFDPSMAQDADMVVKVLASIEELIPGKEYILTIDGQKTPDMFYQGVTDGLHIFNEEDHNAEPKTFSDEEITAVISAGGVEEVNM